MFMGRSGTDRLAAKLLVEELTRAGANVRVIRGDVCNADAITAATRKTDVTIGGVIQAAMSLKVRCKLRKGPLIRVTNSSPGITLLQDGYLGLAS